MVSNTGDTIHCIGSGQQYFNTRKFQPHSHPSCAGYGTEKLYEAYKIEFIDSLKNIVIQLTHYKLKEFPQNYLPFNQNEINDIVEVIFDKGLYYIQDFQISNSNVKTFYFNEILLGGNKYYAVTKIEKDYYQDSSFFLYFNKTEGLLKIQLTNTKTWELLPN